LSPSRPVTTLGIALLKHGSRIPAQRSGFRVREQDFTVYEHLHSSEDIRFSHVTGSPFTFRDSHYAAALPERCLLAAIAACHRISPTSCHTSWFMTLLAGSMSNEQLAAAINETK
jgi:hypothetical protein